MVNLEYVNVKFLAEWMGNPIGSEKQILSRVAQVLKTRGVVEFLNDKKIKNIDTPVKDKMVKVPIKKKGV